MLRNYLTIAYRTLRRQLGYTCINVSGLALGMAACLLIGLYVRDELSHDAFHEQADRIVAIGAQSDFTGTGDAVPYPLGDVLLANVPGVKQVVRVRRDVMTTSVARAEDRSLEREQRVLVADSSFFKVFSFPLVRGRPANVLDAPGKAVITEAMARAFFGDDDPLGQSLTFVMDRGMLAGRAERTVVIAGVVKTPPSNTIFQFDMVVPAALTATTERANEGVFRWSTFLLLDRPVEAAAFTRQMRRAVAPRKDSNFLFSKLDLRALPLSELYLSAYHEASGFSGQWRYIYLFSALALLTLLVAAINYVNLVTAQGQERAREVGVRRTLGAQRRQLAVQFLGETTLLSFGALLLALALASAAVPVFNGLMGTRLSIMAAWGTWALPGLGAFVLLVGIAAGAYPAFLLSGFRPVAVLRGRPNTQAGRQGWLRRGLVVAQFAVSAGLMLCAAVMHAQLQFVQTKSLGFESEHVVTVDLSEHRPRQEGIKRRVQAIAGVQRATLASAVPGDFGVTIGNRTARISRAAHTEQADASFRAATVDADYVETLGLKLVAGRNFRTNRPSDRTRGYLLNEAAAAQMGWTADEAVGKPFTFARGDGAPEGRVIGVVENFHVESLRGAIDPVVLQMEASRYSSGPVLAVRLAPGQISAAMERIEQVVRAQTQQAAFDYAFLDDTFDALYRSERRIAQLFAVFAGVAVAVACLGLFGLAAFAAEQRTKEIAIRKAMGAFVTDIVGLLSKEFALLAAVALAIGTPVAYGIMQQWLQGFAYRTASAPWMVILVAAAVMLMAAGSTSYHAVRAALRNPTDALQ